MSQSDLFFCFLPLRTQTGLSRFPEVHMLPRLSSSFLQVTYTWNSKMRSHVVSYETIYFCTLFMQTCYLFLVDGLTPPSALDVESLPLV